MPHARQSASEMEAIRVPLLGYNTLFLGLRYLFKKKLSYLAMVGVALSVGTLIVVMGVFTGFHLKLTSVIRGYLSDLTIEPGTSGLYALKNWELWRAQVLGAEHVEGVAPYVEGFALLKLPGTGYTSHVFLRGVHPEHEGTVSELPNYMEVGALKDLDRTYLNPAGGRLNSCFVGSLVPGFSKDWLARMPGQLILMTATDDMRPRLKKFAVNGIFQTGDYELDHGVVILALDTATGLVDSAGGVSGLNVRLDSYENAEYARAGIAERLRPQAVLRTYGDAPGRLKRIAISGDASRLAGMAESGQVIVWDVASGRELQGIPAGGSELTALALDATGDRLAVGRADGAASLRQVDSGAGILETEPSGGAVTAMGFSPDGFLLAVGHRSGAVQVWDLDEAEQTLVWKNHGKAVRGLAFGPDGERLLTVGEDGTARLWDTEKGKTEVVMTDEKEAPLLACAFGPAGKTLLAGAADGRATLWETQSGRRIASWPAEEGVVHAVAFDWSGARVLTAGKAGVNSWALSVEEGSWRARRILSIEVPGKALGGTAFDSAGEYMVGIGAEGRAHLRFAGPGFRIKTWQEQRKTFLEAVAMERFIQALILSLMLVLEGFFIFAIVTTMVYERRRDIGILSAVGFTGWQICQVFLIAGLAIGVIGSVIGVGGGVLFAHNINVVRGFVAQVTGFDPFPAEIYYFTEIPAHVGVLTPVLTAGGAIFCSLIFSILPALRAARMDPVESLRHE